MPSPLTDESFEIKKRTFVLTNVQQCGILAKMGSERTASAPGTCCEIEQLRDEVSTLSEVCRVLVSAIDELRIELQYIAHNGLPERQTSHVPTGRRMADDPLAEDWGERLQREPKPTSDDTQHSKPSAGMVSGGSTGMNTHPGHLF